MASGDTDWIFDCVVNIFHSPEWETPIFDFIDEYCIIFDNEEENKFQYSEIHSNFTNLVEVLLESQLNNLGITAEQFVDACDKAKARSGLEKNVIQSLLAMEDFMSFKSMMKKRNMELELEALQQLKHHSEAESKSEALPASVQEGLDSYEQMVRDEFEEAMMMLNLQQEVAIKEAAIEKGKEDRLAALPESEKAREVQSLRQEAKKKDQAVQQGQRRVEELQAEMERAMKVASEPEKSDLKQRLALEEAECQRAKIESEKLSSLAESVQNKQKSHSAAPGSSAVAPMDKMVLEKADMEMKNLRSRMDRLQAVDALPAPQKGDEDLTAVIEKRKRYLREQRTKILAAKQAERHQELEKYKKETDEFIKEELKKPTADPELKEDDRRRQAIRKKLTHRLKMDLLAAQETKTPGIPQPHELESMEDQLQRAQELREEKKRKEKVMTDKMAKEASTRAKKAKDGMKGTEDW